MGNLNCKICGKELENIINELYMCPTKDDKLHTYTAYYKNEDPSVIEMEEFRVLDDKTDFGYIIWIQHADKQTQLRVMRGSVVLSSHVFDSAMTFRNTDEKSLLGRIKKLLILF